mmetsp:Transcript_12369/g.33387  ORF Transcript_12369/g.33387 Transcript_12369/m.33387 type:complete len:275 (-) Transcript_12369:736-1560(-)
MKTVHFISHVHCAAVEKRGARVFLFFFFEFNCHTNVCSHTMEKPDDRLATLREVMRVANERKCGSDKCLSDSARHTDWRCTRRRSRKRAVVAMAAVLIVKSARASLPGGRSVGNNPPNTNHRCRRRLSNRANLLHSTGFVCRRIYCCHRRRQRQRRRSRRRSASCCSFHRPHLRRTPWRSTGRGRHDTTARADVRYTMARAPRQRSATRHAAAAPAEAARWRQTTTHSRCSSCHPTIPMRTTTQTHQASHRRQRPPPTRAARLRNCCQKGSCRQ